MQNNSTAFADNVLNSSSHSVNAMGKNTKGKVAEKGVRKKIATKEGQTWSFKTLLTTTTVVTDKQEDSQCVLTVND